MSKEAYLIKRIEMIEQELKEIKSILLEDRGENVSLLGLWEGANIADEEIPEAKRSLFAHMGSDGQS